MRFTLMLALDTVTIKTVLQTRSRISKILLGVCAVVVAIAAPLQVTNSAVYADQYDDQIRAIQNQVDQYQQSANALQREANTLQKMIGVLNAEKQSIQAQLELSQTKFNKLTADIAANEVKLANNKDALGKIVADLYVDDSISPLEMLASSKNVGEYMDKSEYRSAVSERLAETIDAIKTLKTQLENDQKAVKKVLAQQKAQRASLVAKEAEKQKLLKETKGKEAAYQKQIANSKAKMSAIAAEQQAALARLTDGGAYNSGSVGSFQFRNFSGNMPCGGGGYTLCGAQDSYADQWGLYNRECVSYTAWAAYNRFGKYVTNFSGRGNAQDWPYSAPDLMGASVNRSPAVGSVAILPATPGFAPIGHAMLVEAVLGGGWVRVSQYNFGGTGEYSTMDIKSSGVVFVHFDNR